MQLHQDREPLPEDTITSDRERAIGRAERLAEMRLSEHRRRHTAKVGKPTPIPAGLSFERRSAPPPRELGPDAIFTF